MTRSRSPFFGTWQNTDVTSQSVVSLAFEADRVHAWAGPPHARVGLGAGSIEVFGGLDDPTPVAFTARLPGSGSGELLLQGNINRGLMVLASYWWASGQGNGSALAGRFSREFLARRAPGFQACESSESSGASPISAINPMPPDTGEFLGRWLATEDQADLRSLDIEASETGLSLRVRGSGRRLPAIWPEGESRLFGYSDESGHDTLLLLGRFEWPEGRSDLQIKVAGGTAVVASFHGRRHGKSWFTREFSCLR